MRNPMQLLLSLTLCVLACAAAPGVLAQDEAPQREAPPPQELEPAVDTSAPPEATPPARDTTPEDIDPAVDTSATQDPGSAADSDAAPSAPAAAVTQPRGRALDRLELDTTEITGNRELPKVLYIVPWKRSDLGDLVGKPVNSLLDEVLTPVDRDVFRRENRYYDALTPAESGSGGRAGTATGSPAPANRAEPDASTSPAPQASGAAAPAGGRAPR